MNANVAVPRRRGRRRDRRLGRKVRAGHGGRRRRRRDAVDGPRDRDGVDAAAGILAEAHEQRHVEAGVPVVRRERLAEHRGADRAGAEVAVDVPAPKIRQRRVADDDTARDRAGRAFMRVLEHREHRIRRGRAAVGERALVRVPAEVEPAGERRADEVDLLHPILPDIADHEVTGLPVELEPPRVSQPVGEDLRPLAGLADERVAGWNRVGVAAERIDPQHLPEQRVEVLGVAGRVAGASAVARADVEQPVGPERQRASVVVRVGRMRDRQDRAGRERIGHLRVRRGAPVLGDLNRAAAVDVVDDEPPGLPVARRERDREQPGLAGRADGARDVEERLCAAPSRRARHGCDPRARRRRADGSRGPERRRRSGS